MWFQVAKRETGSEQGPRTLFLLFWFMCRQLFSWSVPVGGWTERGQDGVGWGEKSTRICLLSSLPLPPHYHLLHNPHSLPYSLHIFTLFAPTVCTVFCTVWLTLVMSFSGFLALLLCLLVLSLVCAWLGWPISLTYQYLSVSQVVIFSSLHYPSGGNCKHPGLSCLFWLSFSMMPKGGRLAWPWLFKFDLAWAESLQSCL